jgi:hypothetical protein
MAAILPPEAGTLLDRRVGRLVDGPRFSGETPTYSTDDSVAQELLARLEKHGITATFEDDTGCWYCVFWAPRPGDGTLERLSSGSAETKALAICRAVLNLPLAGSGNRLRLRRATRGWIEGDAPQELGGEDSPRARPVSEDAELLEPTRVARGF